MIRMLAKLLKLLNSETAPWQISLALCLSMVMGFTPLFSIHNVFILLLVLLLRVNISAFILGWLAFSGFAYALDPLFQRLGYTMLTLQALEPLWTVLYNIAVFRLENFNNTIVMGSLIVSLIAFIPVYLLLNWAIRQYRDQFLAWIRKTRILQVLKASKFYRIYDTISGLRRDV